MLPSLGVTVVAREALASLGGGVLAWEGMFLSPGVVVVAGEVLASPGGEVLAWEGVLTWEGVLPSLAGGVCLGIGWINLIACL